MPIDDQSGSDPLDDTCLTHHFIRTQGRRPTPDELQALRDGPLVPRPRHPSDPPLSFPRTLRRQVARAIHRM
ncbi:hypothetical protein L2K70_20105 [Nocardioides KLBMP 9356]|uniref:Uncharacterized protein n=1 Tax=Nocardioides potassii TaxID=2911371 RepID=A0ABS9HIK3_9ACTN|nr:hypothetical protein [Nocardioides potassii]MCF6379923.1 hypothetical protein [Nocardioides potassii]